VGTRRCEQHFIIHQYDEINRAITWQTLSADLPD
jgi:uncharacterized protein with HEPN domain